MLTDVSERPTVAVIRGAIHASSASCCSGKNSSDRIDRERPNVAAIQTIVYRCPAVAIDGKTPPPKYVPAKMWPLELIAKARTSVWITS